MTQTMHSRNVACILTGCNKSRTKTKNLWLIAIAVLPVFLGSSPLCSHLFHPMKNLPYNFGGFTNATFDRVRHVFQRNFKDGWEREGASLAVYHRGQLVVDLYGGYADASCLRQWTDRTRTVVFSASKAIGALCIAMLVDRGHLAYSDLVTKYWPEFGQHGKENVTVEWIMTHRAGLPALDAEISKEHAFDADKMAKLIENQKPYWSPGTKSGYHAITYGWLVDQLMRRADPLGRGVAQFFREEIAIPHEIDFHLGLPKEEEHTVSRLSLPSNWHLLKEITYDPRILFMLAILHLRPPGSIAWKVRRNPKWMQLTKDRLTFNDPELHGMEQVAALGIGTARDLGRIFALMLDRKLISSEKLLQAFRQPQVSSGWDEVVMAPMLKGYGFMYERHPTETENWLIGHPGYGGSSVMFDLDNQIVISYVTNGLKTGMGQLTRTYRVLRNAVFQCI